MMPPRKQIAFPIPLLLCLLLCTLAPFSGGAQTLLKPVKGQQSTGAYSVPGKAAGSVKPQRPVVAVPPSGTTGGAPAPAATQSRKTSIKADAAAKQTQKKNYIYLLHSDVTKFNKMLHPDAEILVGNIVFRHDSVYMYCDSALFYRDRNRMEAYSNVRMEQGDTLFLYSDYLDYDGEIKLARARMNVRLENRNSVLETDSLDFDRNEDLAYYSEGGALYDGQNTLTSTWGEYNTRNKEAVFNYDVQLVNPKFTLTTDTLHYNTANHIARIVSPSQIVNSENHIYTSRGNYNTAKDCMDLLDRSVLLNGGKKFIADSIYYNKKEGYMQAFRDMIYTDSLSRNMMTGNYGYYDEKIDSAYATDSVIMKDYSQGKDTLYMHSDTVEIVTWHNRKPVVLPPMSLSQSAHSDSTSVALHSDSIIVVPFASTSDTIWVDSTYRQVRAYHKVRAYRTDVQAVCDSMVFLSSDSCLTMYSDPILWNGPQQLLGEVIKVYMDTSSIDWMHIVGQALFVQQNDSLHYNQIAGNEMKYFFKDGEVREANVVGNVQVVYYPQDKDSTLIGMNTTEASLLKAYMEKKAIEKIVIPSPNSGVFYPMTQLPADKMRLSNFAWFDYIRPVDKEDIMNWRGKKSSEKLKVVVRKPVPLPTLNKK